MANAPTSNEVHLGALERLVLERREAIVKRLRGRFAHIPKDVSLVDELIAERREEAAREAQEE